MERFDQDFRDSMMISAIERKIDANAGECMKFILQQMYLYSKPWISYSNPISLVDIKHLIEARSLNLELMKYLDQYISILSKSNQYKILILLNSGLSAHFTDDDQLKFISKGGDMGGGQYVVQMKDAIDQLTWVCIENIITEKFGTKAARIFRWDLKNS